ncbi:MAG: dihydropteroate synthase [Gammaproteobacteria bacterium]|nr:dihydropteroate synthase [Gammaproteobacteria bacterium]
MTEQILFLTGKLAEKQLNRVLREISCKDFDWEVRQLGLTVAALMTADMIERRLTNLSGASRILLPGRCRGDLAQLSSHFGIPVERGPEELIDLPRFFGKEGRIPDLSTYNVRIFAEIVDAPQLGVEQILEKAASYTADGADVIDLGCLPDTPFPHLGEAVATLKASGYLVSIDSMTESELLHGGRAGADFLLSLHEESLWITEQVQSTPVLVPSRPGDLASLERAMRRMDSLGRTYIADPILDPIHFGFAESILRYHQLRKAYPSVEIMMGVGNLTELTEADTMGINALMMGLVSELRIGNILSTQVSPHCRSAIREADLARRIMHWAHQENSLPKLVHPGLTGLHEMRPFTQNDEQIRELAEAVRDPNFRIQVGRGGIHVYNRNGMQIHEDPFEFFPGLNLEDDAGHAFYLGVELARAQIARQLGKRYTQDQPLDWGCALPREEEQMNDYQAAGVTLKRKRERP